ncbi:MAG: type II toxin-antitoxin system mRNA interferase toxin, RelE/StbE family [Candidatus Vogelbacteria bacterium]|nr:type II toxin-antitoxin system mRNA interferase toxin, RelE/StbE family [Candidatus Vogelbacteria bacterium]
MKVILHRDFSKQFAKLDRKLRIRFVERKDLFLVNPHHSLLDNHELDHDWAGCRSINITGDFRAIFRPLPADTIEFLAIGTHHQLYGK